MMRKSVCIIFLLISIISFSQSVYPGQFKGKFNISNAAKPSVEAFDFADIELLPSRFRDNMLRDSAWLASIDVDRLVHSFRNNAGVFASREGGYMTVKKYGGWESLDCDLRGHTTGHLMSALALMYVATGDSIFKRKGEEITTALAEVQKAFGNGYLSAYPEELINRNIAGKPVWAPWYTLHKILSGLIDQYLYADNEPALTIAIQMGDWAYNKLSSLDDATRRLMLRNEFGGINEAFYNLYAITGNENYRWLAEFFYHNDVIDPLKQRNADMGTKHTNTFIPKVLAEMRRYEILDDKESLDLSDFFWNNMVDNHIYSAGCLSDKEHFFDPEHFCDHLSGYTGETCCTYNMLKLSRHLFCQNPDEKIADYYERALLNHILGQQDIATGMVCYFLPMQTGSHKVYSTPENSFWCCVGSGFENHAKYAEGIYYHNDDELLVNLFIPSRLLWREKGVSVTLISDFPYGESMTFDIEAQQPTQFALKLRYPRWSNKASLKVNGKSVKVKTAPGDYIVIDRKWRNGDRVEMSLPMELKLEAVKNDENIAALMYGPVLLAAELGTEAMNEGAPFSDPAKYNDYYTYKYNIPEGLDLEYDVKDGLTQTGHELTFKTKTELKVRPLFDIHGQRYGVYWHLKNNK